MWEGGWKGAEEQDPTTAKTIALHTSGYLDPSVCKPSSSAS